MGSFLHFLLDIYSFMKALLPLGNLSNRLWWRSEETVPGMSPYYGFITAINWKLNEVNFAKEIYSF